MATRRPGRVIVGVDDSMTGLRAIRLAVAEARRRGCDLHAVRVWGVGASGNLGLAYLKVDLSTLAAATVREAFDAAMGGPPGDLRVLVMTVEGDRAVSLAAYADQEDDLLVVGATRRRLRRSVAGYCVRHASCPVLVVPPAPPARRVRREMRAIRRDASTFERDGAGLVPS